MKDKVTICISTYNGIKYFHEQLNSILNQSYSNFRILIRDDGSTDINFVNSLKQLEFKDDRIELILGENLGLTNSFFELLKICPKDSDYVAFSDQDDYWYEDRLLNSILQMKEYISIPFLSLCRFEYVDDDLNYISTAPLYKHLGFKNALVQNLATGCTICFNNEALQKITHYIPKSAVIHDWWVYLVISATGKVKQEETISVKYRQHALNVLGGSTSFLKMIKKRFNRKLHQLIYQVYNQLDEFYLNYHEFLPSEKQTAIKHLLKTNHNFKSKFLFLFKFGLIRRERLIDNLILKLVILFSRKDKNKL